MQFIDTFQLIGILLVIGGVFLIIMGIASALQGASNETQTKSKGLILIGPIPIVWGVDKKYQLILVIVGIMLVLVYVLWIYV